MSDQYKRALRAVGDGLLTYTRDEAGHELFCYSRETFLSRSNWNDLTKSHRGALYYKGEMVNKPFEKIFNLGEVDETEKGLVYDRMATEDYTVLHKANGHLFIISSWFDPELGGAHVVSHTKGSLLNPQNDLLRDDLNVFAGLYSAGMDRLLTTFNDVTLMFEAIVSHDKHSMYEHDSKRYGENAFVLLGANVKESPDAEWQEANYELLGYFAQIIGCPLVECGEPDGSVDSWFDHSETEGYVIWFHSDGARVKVKTKEYWAGRFKSDLNVDRVMSMFRSSGKRKFELKLPEEVSDRIIELVDNFYKCWWSLEYVDSNKIFVDVASAIDFGLTHEQRAELFKREDLTIVQKQVIAGAAKGKSLKDGIWDSKNTRKAFFDYVESHPEYKDDLQERLDEIVDSIG